MGAAEEPATHEPHHEPVRPEAQPSRPPTLLYDRCVTTRVHLLDPDSIEVVAHLADDTFGPGGFRRFHDMTVRAVVALEDLTIVELDAGMTAHPHAVCPATVAAVRALTGIRVAAGFNRAVSQAIGGDRGCNHLHTLMQAVGAIVAVSYAAVLSARDPAVSTLPDVEFFDHVRRTNPGVVGSCWAWAADGPVIAHLDRVIAQREGNA